MTANERLVARLLADPDPRMKTAAAHPELRKQIKIFLDGEDVTARCRGFSIPGRRVELYVRNEAGRLLLDWKCGCGTVRGTKRPANWTGPGREDGTCSICGERYSMRVAIEVLIGKVQVTPAEVGFSEDALNKELGMQSLGARLFNLVAGLFDRIAERWFVARLRFMALRGRLRRFGGGLS